MTSVPPNTPKHAPPPAVHAPARRNSSPRAEPGVASTGFTATATAGITAPAASHSSHSRRPMYAPTAMPATMAAMRRPGGSSHRRPCACWNSTEATASAAQIAARYHGPPNQMSSRITGMPAAALATRCPNTCRSLPAFLAVPDGPRLHRTELAHTLRVRIQRPVHLGAVEIGPIGRSGVELGVGRLPEQEVREPHLAGCPHDEVGVADRRGVEVRR